MKALAALCFVCVMFSLPLPAEDGPDADTESALKAIEAVPVRATQPSIAPRPRGQQPRPRAGLGYWLYLGGQFAPALATAASVAIAGGIAGTFVLLRREALVALALPQVVAMGAAVGMRFGWSWSLPPALAAAAGAVGYLVLARRRGAAHAILPALYLAGLSISFLLIANHGRDVEELQNLFTGVDVAVGLRDAWVATPILLGVGAWMAILWRRWLLMAQAPAAAELAGLHPARWDALFLILLAIVLLLGTHALGVVMVLAMLFLPAAAALPWARSVPGAMAIAAMLGVAFLGAGFVLSNEMSWPLSQTVGGVGFVVVMLAHAIGRRH
jgi:zinc/manganese transport system permease protein